MVERERERDAELRKGRSELRYVSITEGEKGRPTLKMLVYTLHPSLFLTSCCIGVGQLQGRISFVWRLRGKQNEEKNYSFE